MQKLKDMVPSSFAAHSVNGMVYGIPEKVGAQRALWVRTDILDKLSLSVPKTLDEFVHTLKTIRAGYPAPDGKPMNPYISKTYHHGYIAGLANYFDVSVDPAVKRPSDTKFREGWNSPQFKDYAEFMKMMWDEGLIDPDHALPQKASGTRSKFYAGKGAYLFMWANRYQSMVEELRKNFPEAELTLVPPIRNPRSGALGMSVVPGYRPYCITKEAKSPQFVWDNLIEPFYLDTEVVTLEARGIPDVNYKVSGDTYVDNFEESGVHLGVGSPFNPGITIPYKLPPLAQRGADLVSSFNGWFAENAEHVVADEPTVTVTAFDDIYKDMKDKKHQLFWKYVLGEHSYDQMMEQFEVYKKEIDFDSILEQVNSSS